MPEAEFTLKERLVSFDGLTWVVVNIHPPQGKRMRYSYTMVREADDTAYLFDWADIEQMGLTPAQAE